jgi:hypothetical protein
MKTCLHSRYLGPMFWPRDLPNTKLIFNHSAKTLSNAIIVLCKFTSVFRYSVKTSEIFWALWCMVDVYFVCNIITTSYYIFSVSYELAKILSLRFIILSTPPSPTLFAHDHVTHLLQPNLYNPSLLDISVESGNCNISLQHIHLTLEEAYPQKQKLYELTKAVKILIFTYNLRS